MGGILIMKWAAKQAIGCRNVFAPYHKIALPALLAIPGFLQTHPHTCQNSSESAHFIPKKSCVAAAPPGQRVIQALASTRNLPGTGLEVQKALRHSRLRVLFVATIQLFLDYRNAFAIMVFFSFLLGQIASSLAGQVSSVVESSSSLQQVLLPIDVFQVVMILVLRFYVFIRRSLIDGKAIGIKECIGIGAIVAFIADSIYFTPQIIAAVRDTHEPVITATSFLLLPQVPIDIAVASIIALSFRLHLSKRSAAWILFLIAILSAGIAALSQQVIAIHTTEINQSVSHLSATSIFHGFPNIILNDIFNNYYATSAPIYPISISIAWFLGLSAVFGCLLGFLLGFRSTFTDKQAFVTSSLPTHELRNELPNL